VPALAPAAWTPKDAKLLALAAAPLYSVALKTTPGPCATAVLAI